MILVDPPEAPFEIIYDADTSDTLLNIVPPAGSQRMYLNAPGDKLDGWNKKKQTGSHTVWSTRNSDYGTGVVGTVRVLNEVSDGIYLTNVDGSKKGLHLLPDGISVDKDAHTITEEFIVANTGTGNSPTVIDDGSDASTWAVSTGTGNVISENGRLKVVGKSSTSTGLKIVKTGVSLTNQHFLCFRIQCSVDKNLFLQLSQSSNYIQWRGARFPISANVDTTFVLPIHAPQGAAGVSPSASSGTIDWNNNIVIYIGTDEQDATEITFYLDNITACKGTWAKCEVAVPDVLNINYGVVLNSYNGSSYVGYSQANVMTTPPTALTTVPTGSSNLMSLDGTKFNDMYGLYSGKGVFSMGVSGKVASGLGNGLPQLTYSSNYGTSKRMGFAILMPPSDNGRTDLNKCRLKLVTYYDDINGNKVVDLSGNGNHGTIVGGVTKLNEGGLKLDGSTGYVNCGTGLINWSSGDWSVCISCTFQKLPTVKSIHMPLISQCKSDGVASDRGWEIRGSKYTNLLQVAVKDTSGKNYYLDSSGEVVLNTIYNCILSYDYESNTLSFSVNGSTTTYTITNPGLDYSTFLAVASYSLYSQYCSDITVYSVRCYNRVLSTEEIAEFNNGGVVSSTGLVLHYTPTPQNMGATTLEFTPQSLDHFTGLDNVGNWIAFERPDKRAEVFLFSRKLPSLSVTEDENGYITNIEIGVKKGTKVARSWVRYPDFDADGNSDDVPNFIDKIVEQLQNKFAFTRKYTNEVDLSGMAVVANDFSIDLQTANPVYPVSSGSRVYDSQGNLLTPVETITTADGNLDLVEVYGKSSIKVFGDENLNYGECKVFDTVTAGNIDESTWLRIYDVNHVFTGDCVVENGLIRYFPKTNAGGKSDVFGYDNSAWYAGFKIQQYSVGAAGQEFQYSSAVITSLTTEQIEFTVNGYNKSTLVAASYTGAIKRGGRFIILNKNTVNRLDLDIANAVNINRFYYGNSNLWDTSYTKPSLSGSYYVAGIDIVNNRITVASGPTQDYSINSDEIYFLGSRQAMCAIPYSQRMYFEAEDMSTTGTGITNYTGSDAYPGSGTTGKTLATQSGGLYKRLVVGTDINPGTYTVFIRAKLGTTANDDIWFQVYNLTLGNFIINTTITGALTWSAVSYSFTIPESSIGHTIDVKILKRWTTSNDVTYDYVLIVPTGLIEKHAKRALVNLNEVKTYKEV